MKRFYYKDANNYFSYFLLKQYKQILNSIFVIFHQSGFLGKS